MGPYPVRVSARPDQPSRWLWLVKWLLLIPHYIVLVGLWVAFVVLTAIAYLAVLFTGRYPGAIFRFNVGVLRWAWRVGYYGYWVLGTDRYPPFTLADVPDYPARLEIDGPPQPKRWLPLVAWLLAIPHIALVTALVAGPASGGGDDGGTSFQWPGLVNAAVLIAGLALLFTARYPGGLRDLLIGVWRWVVRVTAYVSLLTDRYPPFRLDQGDEEPDGPAGPIGPVAMAAPAGSRQSASGTAGGIVALAAGVLVFLGGSALVLGGSATLALDAARDGNGYLTSETIAVSSRTAAITAEGIELHPGDVVGRTVTGIDSIRVTVTGDGPLFVGVAAQDDVDAWLRGTAHDELDGVFDEDTARYDRSAGAVRAVQAPGAQDFWLASASGSGTVTLSWNPGEGRFALVLANADGTPSVAADATVAVKTPVLRPLGLGLLGGGLVMLLVGGALIYLGAASVGGGTTTGGAGGGPRPTGPQSSTRPTTAAPEPDRITDLRVRAGAG